MRPSSLVVKITLYTCGLVSVFMILGSAALINMEAKVVSDITARFKKNLMERIEKRAQGERRALARDLRFNARILAEMGASHLYNMRARDLMDNLCSLLEYPELVAISVLDDQGQPFAAAWKTRNGVAHGKALPKDSNTSKDMSLSVDSMLNGRKVGRFIIYYTDAYLEEHKNNMMQEAQGQAANFFRFSKSRLDKVVLGQMLGVGVILSILVICLVWLLRRMVRKPLITLGQLASRLRNFDLTARVEPRRNDEIGGVVTAINDTTAVFAGVVGLVQQSGAQVAKATRSLAEMTQDQLQRARDQNLSMDQARALVSDITNAAEKVAGSMKEVAAISEDTAGLAFNGQTDLRRVEKAVRQMAGATRTVSSRLASILAEAESITSVVTTMTRVADQTNLLSLNAAIEAEKAGPYGKGFAVVAEEIRRLADQTAAATLDIEAMVTTMQNAVNNGVRDMEQFMAEVSETAKDIEKISARLSEIVGRVKDLSPRFEDANQATQRQFQQARRIREAMDALSERMDSAMQTLAQSHEVVDNLNTAVARLVKEVSVFKVSKNLAKTYYPPSPASKTSS